MIARKASYFMVQTWFSVKVVFYTRRLLNVKVCKVGLSGLSMEMGLSHGKYPMGWDNTARNTFSIGTMGQKLMSRKLKIC